MTWLCDGQTDRNNPNDYHVYSISGVTNYIIAFRDHLFITFEASDHEPLFLSICFLLFLLTAVLATITAIYSYQQSRAGALHRI